MCNSSRILYNYEIYYELTGMEDTIIAFHLYYTILFLAVTIIYSRPRLYPYTPRTVRQDCTLLVLFSV